MYIQSKQAYRDEKFKKILFLNIILAIIIMITFGAYDKITTSKTEVYSLYVNGILTPLEKKSDGYEQTNQHYQTSSIDTIMKYAGIDKQKATEILYSSTSNIVIGHIKSKSFALLIIILVIAAILLFSIIHTYIIYRLGMKNEAYRYKEESILDTVMSSIGRWSSWNY